MTVSVAIFVSFAMVSTVKAHDPSRCAEDEQCDSTGLLQVNKRAVSPKPCDKPGTSCRAPPDSALLVIDMQNDFVSPNGSLSVTGGLDIVSTINELTALPGWNLIAFTEDYHPSDHVSFARRTLNSKPFSNVTLEYGPRSLLCGRGAAASYGSSAQAECNASEVTAVINQTLWPAHCVQHSWGQQLHSGMVVPDSAFISRKGHTITIDSYGALENVLGERESNLAGLLELSGVKTVYLVGLALDYCVKWTALQCQEKGLSTHVVIDATKPVAGDTGANAIADIESAGITTVSTKSVADCR